MAIDRAAVVRKADEFISQGKLGLAIEEYRALVEEQPGDLGAANTLGDLYARNGELEKAIDQFTRLAESERSQGFASKAIALYKKALKVDPGCELALARLADIAVGQELLADATLYWNRLLQCQRARNDDAGVADTLVRLADLPVAKADTKLVAARTADRHLPHQSARLFVDAARALERESRLDEAVEAWVEAVQRSDDVEIRRDAAKACLAIGAPERALPLVTPEVAGDDPALRALLGEPAAAHEVVTAAAEPALDLTPDEPAATPETPADQWIEISTDADEFDPLDALAELEEDEPVPVEPAWAGPPAHDGAVAVQSAPPVVVPIESVVGEWADEEDMPLDDDSLIAQLEVAAGTPGLQFQASAQLGRLFVQRGQLERGVEWLQRACLAPAPVRDHGLAAQYDLADALERVGQLDRALAVWSDLEFDAGAYRDVSERVARLNRRGSAR